VTAWKLSLIPALTLLPAAAPAQTQDARPEPSQGVAIVLDGREVARVYSRSGTSTAEDRALLIRNRLLGLAGESSFAPDSVQARESAGSAEIFAGERFLMAVTDEDAAAARRPKAELARLYAANIRDGVAAAKERRGARKLLLASVQALGVTAVGILLILLLRWGARRARGWIRTLRAREKLAVRFQSTVLIGASEVAAVLQSAVTVAFWLLIFVLLQIYIPVVLSFFPGTEALAARLSEILLAPVRTVWSALAEYLPNLVMLVVGVILTRYAIRISDFAFEEIHQGRWQFEGFHTEWAEPTARIGRILIVALAAVVLFPYLPGSKSPAFQGVSLFFGLLISLGSTSAVANGVAGTILVYMRPFQVGDRVKIADTVGDVVERSLLITRIRTVKNVVITIPNSSVLGAHIVNYSASAKDPGLILHTQITIGYDAPWRKVHELLIAAALDSTGVLPEPKPFVHQLALNDFYVTYEINAFIREANRLEAISAALHAKIQDKFNEGGVEIMSPHYAQLRDGNRTTIPDAYLPAGYKPGGIRVTRAGSDSGEAIG
jgi:small-conductance mechanosensitive channel